MSHIQRGEECGLLRAIGNGVYRLARGTGEAFRANVAYQVMEGTRRI